MGKKVGIITYHFARNYGAVLQCYALQRYLSESGNSVKILNAVSIQQEKNNSLYSKKNGLNNIIYNLCLLPFFFSRRRKEKGFASYVDSKLNCTEKVHDVAELKNLIDKDKYDAIISGSDQVWNPHIADFDEMFLFPFKTSAKKIGYSVSIGESSYEDIRDYASSMEDFDAVGLREHTALGTLNRLYSKKIVDTVDPVLLLSREQWEAEAKNKVNSFKKPYMLCYFIDKAPVKKNLAIAEKIAAEKGLAVKVIWMHLSTLSFDRRFINDAGPDEFLSYMYNADAIITDGYHGTVFSTLFNKEFYSIINNPDSTDTRIKDYLTMLGLQDRMIIEADGMIAENAIDYDIVNRRLVEVPVVSKEFLSSTICS